MSPLSFKLQKEKKWADIASLEKYKGLINKLNDKQSTSLKNRIEKAKKELRKAVSNKSIQPSA